LPQQGAFKRASKSLSIKHALFFIKQELVLMSDFYSVPQASGVTRQCFAVGTSRPLKNVGDDCMDAGGRAKQDARAEAASARQKQAKKQSLRVVNEHFEPVFNAAMATQVVFQGVACLPE
jgi:hypothetical protein